MDYNEELSHRKRSKHVKLIVSIIVFVAIVLVGGGIYLFLYTDIFYFARVEITGLKNLKKEDVIANGRVSFFDRLDFNNPLIKTSVISRNYISRKLDIAIEEREPYAIWCEDAILTKNHNNIVNKIESTSSASISASSTPSSDIIAPSNCYWFDKDGLAFSEAPDTEGTLLRSVQDVSGRDVHLGNYVLPDNQRAILFKVFDFVNAAGVEVKQFRVESGKSEEVTALTKAGPPIYFSLRLDPAFAIEPFRASIASLLPSLQYLDLRSENKIFYK